MIRTHKIRLNPTEDQEQYFLRAAGVARYTWNRCLAEYKALKGSETQVDWNDIKKRFRASMDEFYPFVREVTKCAFEEAISDLRQSIATYYKVKKQGDEKIRFPGWRSRNKKIGGFGLANDKFCFEGNSVRIPKLGWVNMAEPLRFDGKVKSGRVVERAGKWYLIVVVEVVSEPRERNGSTVGIDFGLSTFATCSDGTVYKTQRYWRKSERRVGLLQRGLARKKKGSKNRTKWKGSIARAHERVANQRQDYCHKVTTEIARKHGTICVEDLCLRGMTKTTLAKSVHDAGIGMTVKMLEYKAEVVKVSRWYPSSQLCSVCGYQNRALTLSDRAWLCPECLTHHNRDENASHNIEAEGKRIKTAGDGYIGVTPVEFATSTGICSTRQVAGCEAGTQGAHF